MLHMVANVEHCRLEELPKLLALIDAEFVFAKDRHVSLAKRFPQVFCETNLANIYLAYVENSICSVAVIKRFAWIAQSRIWQGAMIGMIYTRPEYRGQGLASLIMRTVQSDLTNAGVDFAVLWTTIPSFYQRLEWVLEDKGIFGEVELPQPVNCNNLIATHSLTDKNIRWIEHVHSKWVPERVVRSKLDYRAMPLPATSVDAFMADETDELQGYALVGRSMQTGYVYEMVGHSDVFDRLWCAIANHYRKIYVNDRRDTPSTKWLDRNARVIWKPQRLAMWLRLSKEADNAPVGQWYIPYFDRI